MRVHLLLLCAGVAGCLGPSENPVAARSRQGLPGDIDASTDVACSGPLDCVGGMACINNVCVVADAGTGGCAENIDCYPTGDTCTAGQCSCGTSSTVCATGNTCVASACLPSATGGGGGTTDGGGGTTGGGGGTTNTCATTCVAMELGTSCNANNQCLCGEDVCGTGEKCHDNHCTAICVHRPRDADNLPFTACIGRPGFELGASISMCGPDRFVAGAPGGSAMLIYSAGDGGWARASDQPGGRFGESVLCHPQAPVFAGPLGVRSLLTSYVWQNWWSRPGYALAPVHVQASTNPQFLMTAKGDDGGHLLMRTTALGDIETLDGVGETTFGLSMASGPYVATGSPTQSGGALDFFEGEPPTWSDRLTSNSPGAGLALAMGDVFPGSGEDDGVELLVASQTNIAIFRKNKGLKAISIEANIDPSAIPGPPVSLAIETRPLVPGASTHAWWYGVPSLNIVHRCVGTYCFPSNPVTTENAAFGASLGIAGSTLVIGAPAYDGGAQGAVFIVNLDDFDAGAYTGEDQLCTHGTGCCTSAYQLGVCIGGVFCTVTQGAEASPYCLPPDGGVDAGVDGGIGDGGSQSGNDGGVDEAGPVQFATCGCTSANGAFAAAALVLLMLRRKAAAR